MSKGCCSPTADGSGSGTYVEAIDKIDPADANLRSELRATLVKIPGGFFDMGARKSRFPEDRDSPRRRVKITPFLIAPCAVTNREYARFVEATGYRTVAEVEGWSFVFHLFLQHPERYESPPGLPWWRKVDGTCWTAPEGPGSAVDDRLDHPVVHMSWFDATAYCHWADLRLPSETEWERAARGGIAKAKFPWGNSFMPAGKHAMNTWQGHFPHENTAEDGYIGTAPVDAFSPNGFGLYNMTGNVWEWAEDFFEDQTRSGAPFGGAHVQRGGSYLCHNSYCDRYQVHSRTGTEPDSSAGHSGFRTAADLVKIEDLAS